MKKVALSRFGATFFFFLEESHVKIKKNFRNSVGFSRIKEDIDETFGGE